MKWSKSDVMLIGPYLLFYLVHVIGLLWTEDKDNGIFNLEVKASFLLSPFLFLYLKKIEWPHTKHVLNAFVAGLIISGVFFLVRSAHVYFYKDMWIQHFFGSRLAQTIHAGYYGLYLNIGSVILFFKLYHGWRSMKAWVKLGHLLVMFFLFLLLFLSSAKNPILSYLIVSLMLLVGLYVFKRPLRGILLMVATVLIFGVVLRNSEKTYLRFQAMFKLFDSELTFKRSDTESSRVRLAAWEVSTKLISEKPLLGTGTGDDESTMMSYYDTHQYCGAYLKKMDSHNQILESTVKLGIMGLVSAIIVLLCGIIRGVRRKDSLLLYMSLMFFIMSLTESVFEVQAGVIVFGLIICLQDIAPHLIRRDESIKT